MAAVLQGLTALRGQVRQVHALLGHTALQMAPLSASLVAQVGTVASEDSQHQMATAAPATTATSEQSQALLQTESLVLHAQLATIVLLVQPLHVLVQMAPDLPPLVKVPAQPVPLVSPAELV